MPQHLSFRLFSFLLLFFPPLLFAQTPPPGLSGSALRVWMKSNFYDGKHTDLGYSTARARMYGHIDNVNNTIVCIYGGYAHPWQQGSTGTNPAPINTEHTIPQAFFGGTGPARSDLHHIFPSYNQWNSNRASHPFGEIPDAQTTNWMRLTQSQSNIPSSNIDEYSEGTNSMFEPREDHKGDCARAIFYIFTMYSFSNHDINDLGDINTLYQWHLQDPPSTKELQRNDDIESWQGNRNPYIDHPEWAGPAWGFGVPAPSEPMNLQIVADTNQLMISWDDVADETGYYIYRSSDNSNFSLLDSTIMDVVSYTDNSVLGGLTYYYYVAAFNAVGNSPNSVTVSGAPIAGMGSGGYASDLMISEYIEGTGFNKALEIANGTGAVVDLSQYSLQKQLNGAGAWTDELVLSGLLADGEVWVIASSAASTEILSQADVSSNSNLMIFNGNDPIGLFKNGVLIDVVGTVDAGGVDFGEDITLVRRPYIVNPNVTYDLTEWQAFPINQTDQLGWHQFDPSANSLFDWFSPSSITGFGKLELWPNPAITLINISFFQPSSGLNTIDVCDLWGRYIEGTQLFLPRGEQNLHLRVAHLKSGMYLLKIRNQEGQQTSTRFLKH